MLRANHNIHCHTFRLANVRIVLLRWPRLGAIRPLSIHPPSSYRAAYPYRFYYRGYTTPGYPVHPGRTAH